MIKINDEISRKLSGSFYIERWKTIMLAVGMVFALSSLSQANNHKDRYFSFQLYPNRKMAYTSTREKTDASYAYAKVSTITEGKMQTTLHSRWNRNLTQRNYYLGLGQSSYILNSAYETYGHCDVKLGGRTQYQNNKTIKVTGYWSLDSI